MVRRHARHNVGRTTRWERHDQSGRSARLGPYCRGCEHTDECDDRKRNGQTNSPVPLHAVAPLRCKQRRGLIVHRLYLAETSGELARRNARQRRCRSYQNFLDFLLRWRWSSKVMIRTSGPDQFAAFIASEKTRWSAVARLPVYYRKAEDPAHACCGAPEWRSFTPESRHRPSEWGCPLCANE